MINSKCKICRRAGTKIFLKGDRCLSPKCPMVRRPYPPGQKGKGRTRGLSEYGKELKEKQKLKNLYNLRENQFRNYVKEVLKKRGGAEDISDLLIKKLESRLDNIVFRLGFALSRLQARQAINHGKFLVNGKKVKAPSYQVKKGDKITPHPSFFKKENSPGILKKYKPPSWLEFDIKKIEGKVIGEPSLEETGLSIELSSIFEYYSR
ncbi:MAG: 30S ribosomal protein S4 [Candidatus Nealsonbacteria bacterium]|nr:30S ribosomal protein S4 [Candidatus Nealsonbacteria bacterium]